MMNNSEIQELLRDFIEKTTHKVKDITISENDSSSTWFSVEMEDPRTFLDREGEGVFALNHLIRKMIECKNIKKVSEESKEKETSETSEKSETNEESEKSEENENKEEKKEKKNNEEDTAKQNKSETGLGVIIDINGFQKRKVDNVRSVAHMMAERARYFKSNIEIDPMPAFERRIIHEFLSTAEDLKTESEGVGHLRRVVIKYIGEI